MKRTTCISWLAVALVAVFACGSLYAETINSRRDFAAEVNLEGPWYIDNVEVTATATQINQLISNGLLSVGSLNVSTQIVFSGSAVITASGNPFDMTTTVQGTNGTGPESHGSFRFLAGAAYSNINDEGWVDIDLFEAQGAEQQATRYGRIRVVAVDTTTGTVDGRLEFMIPINDTMTELMNLNLTGMGVNGDIVGDASTVVTNVDQIYAVSSIRADLGDLVGSNTTALGTFGASGLATFTGSAIVNGPLLQGDGVTVVTNMALVEADAYQVGGVDGLTQSYTNSNEGFTNVITIIGGLITDVTTNP